MLRAKRNAFMADIAVKSPGRQQGAALLERGMMRNKDIEKTSADNLTGHVLDARPQPSVLSVKLLLLCARA